METNIDVLNFLNQMELYNIVSGVELKTFIINRKILLDEFENIDLDKLVEMMKILDDLYTECLKMRVYFEKSLITTLRNKIFDMYDQKMVENSNNA